MTDSSICSGDGHFFYCPRQSKRGRETNATCDGNPIYEFPRVACKLAWMAVELMIARQLTWFAARQKDSDKRCDIEAGMAKLLAARVAWPGAETMGTLPFFQSAHGRVTPP